MRFLLDNDVDAGVVAVFQRAGHECWTANAAGLAGQDAATDDQVSVYAAERRAVVVTHDSEFSRRRMRQTFGKHLWLRCEQPDAANLVEQHLRGLPKALLQHDELVVVLSANGMQVHPPQWR